MKFEEITEWNKQNGIEVSVKQKKQIEHEFIGSIIPHNNHKIWEINNETLEIKEAKYAQATAVMFGITPPKEIIINLNCTYVSSLNIKNALKKYNQGVNGSKNIWDKPLQF